MAKLFPLVSLFVLAAAASPLASATPAGGEPIDSKPARAAGLKVSIDPETGEINSNPTYEQLERLSDGGSIQPRRSAWELRGFALANGGRGVFLDGWADHSLRLEVTDDGSLRAACSQGDRHDPADSETASEAPTGANDQ